MRERPGVAFGRRGISDVVGYVLVFSLVVSVVGVVSVAGFSSLDGVRDAEQANNAERAFDVLADNVADVYANGAPSRGTEISLSDASLRTTETVTVNVTARNTTTSNEFIFKMGSTPIVWQGTKETELVYSLGAVLRQEPDGGVVIDETPSQYDSDRTFIHLVQLRAPQKQVGGTTVRLRTVASSSEVLLPEGTDYDELRLNITTPRADIWRRHLERYPDTDCSVVTVADVPADTVTCDLSDRDAVYVTLTRIDVSIEG